MNIDLAQAYPFIFHGETQHRPLVGISACLCGDRVRYDGQDKGLPDLIQPLETQLKLLKVCPEVAIGMGVPRPPIQLSRNRGGIEARGVKDPQHNVTTALQNYAQSLINEYALSNPDSDVLCGFILKSRSPSCGTGSTPIHEEGLPIDVGSGIFSQQLQQQLPWLPIVEEEGLFAPQQQLNFIFQSQLVQLFWQNCLSQKDGLTVFHKQINHLLAVLSVTVRSDLEQLLEQSLNTHYLTRLITALHAEQKST